MRNTCTVCCCCTSCMQSGQDKFAKYSTEKTLHTFEPFSALLWGAQIFLPNTGTDSAGNVNKCLPPDPSQRSPLHPPKQCAINRDLWGPAVRCLIVCLRVFIERVRKQCLFAFVSELLDVRVKEQTTQDDPCCCCQVVDRGP